MQLTDEQLRILRHMLGIDTRDERNPQSYRDYYCAAKGDKQLKELAELGAVRLYRTDEHYEWYTTTEAGADAARASQRAMLHPRSKRMYSKFLDVRDCCEGLTFKEFLTGQQFKETRDSV